MTGSSKSSQLTQKLSVVIPWIKIVNDVTRLRRINFILSRFLLCKLSHRVPYLAGEVPILVPRGHAPFGQHQESRPLARSNDIPVLNGFVNTIDWDQNQSDLSDLTLSMRRVTGSPWIADFRCWTWPEVAILGADQKECGLWGREWGSYPGEVPHSCFSFSLDLNINFVKLNTLSSWLADQLTVSDFSITFGNCSKLSALGFVV